MPTVYMPDGAAAAGEAFEMLVSRYLSDFSGLSHLAAPFYMRLPRGRWVQFDGLFSRAGGQRLALEAKFYQSPITLATPGVAARVTFAKEAGVKGLILASRRGFSRDVMRARLGMEKILISWAGMARQLARWGRGGLTAALDPVVESDTGFRAASGAVLRVNSAPFRRNVREGFTFLPVGVERWLRRLPASLRDIDADAPGVRFRPGGASDIESAWAIEDSLRGFAPADPRLLEMTLALLAAGPLDLDAAWRTLWRRGCRGRRTAVRNALDDLKVIGAARKYRAASGVFYEVTTEVNARPHKGAILEAALARWPAYVYFVSVLNSARENKYSLAARLSAGFARFHPYARSLYNPAKVSGLLALERYMSSGSSTTSPS